MEEVTSQSFCLLPRSLQFQSFSKQILLAAEYKIWLPRVESCWSAATCGLWSPKLDQNGNNPRVPEENKHSSEQWMKANRTQLGRQGTKHKHCTCCILSLWPCAPALPHGESMSTLTEPCRTHKFRGLFTQGKHSWLPVSVSQTSNKNWKNSPNSNPASKTMC